MSCCIGCYITNHNFRVYKKNNKLSAQDGLHLAFVVRRFLKPLSSSYSWTVRVPPEGSGNVSGSFGRPALTEEEARVFTA